MEKINVAELLKDCPEGMELDCTMYDNITFCGINERSTAPINIKRKDGIIYQLTKYGQHSEYEDAKCVIFPKGKTTWVGFVPPSKFKDGDILYIYSANPWICIYKEGGEKENVYYKHVAITSSSFVYDCSPLCHRHHVQEIRHATEEEKKKLFQAIKDNGYKWNTETKTLEKLPKFKVGDKINPICSDRYYIIENIEFDRYILDNNQFLKFTDEHHFELAPNKLVSPKFKVGDKVRVKNCVSEHRIIDGVFDTFYSLQMLGKIDFTDQDNWELVPDKFDINTLVPFESRVLVRAESGNFWKPAIFGCYVENAYASYFTVGGNCWEQCITYENNEHLLGTTDDCDEYFKTWE